MRAWRCCKSSKLRRRRRKLKSAPKWTNNACCSFRMLLHNLQYLRCKIFDHVVVSTSESANCKQTGQSGWIKMVPIQSPKAISPSTHVNLVGERWHTRTHCNGTPIKVNVDSLEGCGVVLSEHTLPERNRVCFYGHKMATLVDEDRRVMHVGWTQVCCTSCLIPRVPQFHYIVCATC